MVQASYLHTIKVNGVLSHLIHFVYESVCPIITVIARYKVLFTYSVCAMYISMYIIHIQNIKNIMYIYIKYYIKYIKNNIIFS